jgi:hypothetical protein
MDLTPYVDTVRRELAVAAEAGGTEARELAERLTAPLASALRLTLLDALSAAAGEITRELAPGSVEVRLRAGDPAFAVTPGAVTQHSVETPAPGKTPEPEDLAPDDDSTMVRINLRLPENLKARVEAAAATEGRSVNSWLVRAASAALQQPAASEPAKPTGGRRSSQRYTGWVS